MTEPAVRTPSERHPNQRTVRGRASSSSAADRSDRAEAPKPRSTDFFILCDTVFEPRVANQLGVVLETGSPWQLYCTGLCPPFTIDSQTCIGMGPHLGGRRTTGAGDGHRLLWKTKKRIATPNVTMSSSTRLCRSPPPTLKSPCSETCLPPGAVSEQMKTPHPGA